MSTFSDGEILIPADAANSIVMDLRTGHVFSLDLQAMRICAGREGAIALQFQRLAAAEKMKRAK